MVVKRGEEEEIDFNQYSYAQPNYGGNPTDAYIIEQMHRKRKEAEQARLSNPVYQERQRKEMQKLHKRIEEGKNTCPHCNNYHIMEEFREHVTFSTKALLMPIYGNHPGLHDHILRHHPEVIKELQDKSEIRKKHRDNVFVCKRLLTRCNNLRYDAEQIQDLEVKRRMAIRYENERRQLVDLINQIDGAEQKHPDLIEVRKEYLRELATNYYA